MDVNWNKFPNINLGCFGWFLIFIEIISFSLLDKGYVGLIFQVCNSFRSNLRPLLIISKIYLSLLYSYQFLLKYLKLSPANFITSLSSSIGISWKGSGPTDFNVYFLGYLSLWLLLHCFWYWPNLFRYPYCFFVLRVLRESMQGFWAFERGTAWLKRTFRCRKELHICSNIHHSLLYTFSYKQSIFEYHPENCLSFSKELPLKLFSNCLVDGLLTSTVKFSNILNVAIFYYRDT